MWQGEGRTVWGGQGFGGWARVGDGVGWGKVGLRWVGSEQNWWRRAGWVGRGERGQGGDGLGGFDG